VAGAVRGTSGDEKLKDPEIVLVTNFFDELKAKFSPR
jgi:hypothetical protein